MSRHYIGYFINQTGIPTEQNKIWTFFTGNFTNNKTNNRNETNIQLQQAFFRSSEFILNFFYRSLSLSQIHPEHLSTITSDISQELVIRYLCVSHLSECWREIQVGSDLWNLVLLKVELTSKLDQFVQGFAMSPRMEIPQPFCETFFRLALLSQ